MLFRMKQNEVLSDGRQALVFLVSVNEREGSKDFQEW